MTHSTRRHSVHLRFEMQQLQKKNIRLSKENTVWKNQIDDLNESNNHHLKVIADLEKTVAEERNNYRQLLENLVKTAEENAKFSAELNMSEERREKLENEFDHLKAKLSSVGDDFIKLQEMLDQQEATIRHILSINLQVKSRYLKYKSMCHKLSAKLSTCTSCHENPSRQKLMNISLFEEKSRMKLSNCVNQLAENEINTWLSHVSRIYNINFGELKTSKTEYEILREKCFYREKQFTEILKEAKARVLSLLESAKAHQTEVDHYKERIMLLTLQNKEIENEMKNSVSKKLADAEEEKTRLRDELGRTNHRVEILTQRILTLQQLSRLNMGMTEDSNVNANYCFSSQPKEETSVVDECESVTETVSTNNSINYSVLRTISLTSDTMFMNNSFDGNQKGNLEWVNEDDGKQKQNIPETFNYVALNETGCNNDVYVKVSFDSSALQRKQNTMRANKPWHSEFKCSLCPARCRSLKSLEEHCERKHMRAKGGIITKGNNSHYMIKYHSKSRRSGEIDDL